MNSHGGKSSYFRTMARCASLPPNQTLGIASTTSATGYHFGPNSGPLSQVAAVPAIAASRPMTPSVQTWPIGFLAARRAVTEPPAAGGIVGEAAAKTKE